MKSLLHPKKFAFALIGAIALASGAYLIASDHIDAPAVTGKTSDLTDFYAFQSPANSDNMVFVVNTQGLLSPATTGAAKFDADVMLEINIDTNGDAVEDNVLQVTFQNGKVQVYGPAEPEVLGANSSLAVGSKKVEGEITAYGAAPSITTLNTVSIFAGPRDDPFFFDLDQYHAVIGGTASSFNNPGKDTFAGTNVMAVVIELPKALLNASLNSTVNTWVTSNRVK